MGGRAERSLCRAGDEAVREILVRGPNWLGDLVMSTPGLRALRAGFPAARITLQVRQAHAALFADAPFVDRVLGLAAPRLRGRALLSEARALRRAGPFDLGVCIPDSWSSALLMRLAGVREVVGYARAGRGLLLSRSLEAPPEWGRRRMVARERFVLGLSAALGCPDRGSRLELHVSAREREALAALLRERGADLAAGPTLGLAPGAGYGPAKRWPLSHFAALGDALSREGARVVLIGAPSEAPLTAALAAAMQEPALDLGGRLDVGMLKALIQQLALLVCNDAGARHVAVALGTPSIVLFGPTSLAKTDLNLERVSVLESDAACRPCYRRQCPIDHRCLRDIGPELAIEHARRALAEAGVSSLFRAHASESARP